MRGEKGEVLVSDGEKTDIAYVPRVGAVGKGWMEELPEAVSRRQGK